MSEIKIINQSQILNLKSGVDITVQVSGDSDIGSPSMPFRTVYADNIVSSGSTGEFVNITGDTMTGPLYLPVLSGTIISGDTYSVEGHVIPVYSGVSDLGSADFPFRTVYADDLVDMSGSSMFLKIDGSNSMTGTLNGPVISGTIISGDSIYKGGIEISNLYVNVTGDTITGTLNVDVLSGTTISGNYANIPTIDSILINSSVISGTVISGDSLYIGGTEISDIYVDIAGDSMTGTLNVPVLSGTTISGNTIYENGDRVIVSGTNLGTSIEIFSGKNVNNLEFKTVSGTGLVEITSDANTVYISGAIAQNYTAPETTTDYGVMLWSGTTAEGFRDSNIIVSDNGNTLNASVISGTIISGDSLYVGGTEINDIYVNVSGDTMTGPLYLPVLSGTTISGNTASIGNNITVFTSASIGTSNISSGVNSFSAGLNNKSLGEESITLGLSNTTEGGYSIAEGWNNYVKTWYAHAEGHSNYVDSNEFASHVEGENNIASGNGQNHLENRDNKNYGGTNHIEGNNNISYIGSNSNHIEGGYNEAYGSNEHVEGTFNKAYLDNSHVQGYDSIASGDTAFAAGYSARAMHDFSIAFSDRNGVETTSTNQFMLGFSSGVTFSSGTNLYTTVSGVNTIGSADYPFSGVYTDSINDNIMGYNIFSEIPSGTSDGINTDFYLQRIPYSHSERVYLNGLRMIPQWSNPSSYDYSIVTSGITFSSAPASGSVSLVDYIYT